MRRKVMLLKLSKLSVLIAIIILTLSGCGLLREPAEPSAPIEAIPLETSVPQNAALATIAPDAAPEGAGELEAAVTTTTATVVPLPTAAIAAQPAYPEGESTVVEQPAIIAEPYPVEKATAESAPLSSGATTIFQIDSAASQVRFELNEELRGEPTLVVGTTDQVAGELSLNLSDLTTAQVGILQINARTLLTDNNFRNRAIQNQILETNEFEFITFAPTAVNGLPSSVQVGETVQFTIVGDLTIRDITQPVEFTVQATPLTDTQLTGTANTIINRIDFDLNIPSAPGVANVEEEVELYIEFVANAS
jgi:polyisoprenoid-binding protein YceI